MTRAPSRPPDRVTPRKTSSSPTGGGYHLLRLISTGSTAGCCSTSGSTATDGNLAVARRRVRMLADDLVAA